MNPRKALAKALAQVVREQEAAQVWLRLLALDGDEDVRELAERKLAAMAGEVLSELEMTLPGEAAGVLVGEAPEADAKRSIHERVKALGRVVFDDQGNMAVHSNPRCGECGALASAHKSGAVCPPGASRLWMLQEGVGS